jgi:hypothetical protein
LTSSLVADKAAHDVGRDRDLFRPIQSIPSASTIEWEVSSSDLSARALSVSRPHPSDSHGHQELRAMTKIVGVAKPCGASGPTDYRMLRVIGMPSLILSVAKIRPRAYSQTHSRQPILHSFGILCAFLCYVTLALKLQRQAEK